MKDDLTSYQKCMESILETQFPFKAATVSHLPTSRGGFLEKSQVLGKQCLNILIAIKKG